MLSVRSRWTRRQDRECRAGAVNRIPDGSLRNPIEKSPIYPLPAAAAQVKHHHARPVGSATIVGLDSHTLVIRDGGAANFAFGVGQAD